MRVSLNLHDWSVLNNRMDLLLKLKERFPSFKVSLVAVPNDIKHQKGNREEALTEIKKHLDWIEIIPHGLNHNGTECRNWTYDDTKKKLKAIKECFKKDGLPFKKGFAAPHWTWNKEVVRALDDTKWFGCVSPKRADQATPKRFFIHNYSIDENFPQNTNLKLYGHINPICDNDLEKCIDNLFSLPQETEWVFITKQIHEAL